MGGLLFKVKLASGRILGPLDIDRVRQLILKNQVVGTETAREYPKGEWVDINSIPAIADLLVARAENKLEALKISEKPVQDGYVPVVGDLGATYVLPGATPLVPETRSIAPLQELQEIKEVPQDPPTAIEPPGEHTRMHPVRPGDLESAQQDEHNGEHSSVAQSEDHPGQLTVDEDRTKVDVGADLGGALPGLPDVHDPDNERTRVEVAKDPEPSRPGSGSISLESQVRASSSVSLESALANADVEARAMIGVDAGDNMKRIAQERTVVFQRSADGTIGTGGQARVPKRPNKIYNAVKSAAVIAAVLMLAQELLFGEQSKAPVKWQPIRPKLPEYIKGDPHPQESNQIYAEAMRDYVLDNVAGYKAAAEKLRKACANDIGNVKALAMLASSYINLIDSSNKDENYFAVISKLIDMSRAKSVDLSEAVIADVEFFVTINKAEAAQGRIVEYTKTHQFGPEMFYYLALAYYQRGDAQNAARYLGQIPDNKAFSAKVFYLRGLVAEKLNDPDSAFKEYEKAVKQNPAHVKSRLKIAELMSKKGELKHAAAHLDYLVTSQPLLSPKDLGKAYFLHAQLSQLYGKPDIALGDMERAVKLDHDNHDYQLELYTLRAKAGDKSVKSVQKEARMYYFLSEGEKVLRVGQHHEALIQFLQAAEVNTASPLPLVKIGDMFRLQNDLNNATLNYRKAAEKAPNNIEVWSKYINVLIQSYEWDEAQKAMAKFRAMPVPQSAIDKAAADMYAKQGRHTEAQIYYKKAMGRESVDPDVYIAFAKSLMETKNFREAPFFFALALRFDPYNVEATLGTAKCIAATDSIDRAISMLQDELAKSTRASAEVLSAIAEFNIQKGEWEQAQQNVDQARVADPEYAYAWKLQAQIHMNKEGVEKDALDKALAAYQSYSERNPSDPMGYMERYNIYLKKTDFEKAGDELTKIYAVFPKYPKLHFYRGWLYAAQGNHKLSAEEYQKELQNNPDHIQTLLALGKEKVELGQVAGAGGAQELFTKAMQLAPTNADAKQQAGYAAYLLKNYQASVALYNAALIYDKANPLIFKRLGMTYRDMGDAQGAAKSFHKYLEMEPDAPDKAEFEHYR
jgi:tetratricopeptide (TPR) repeat protein